MLAQVQRVELLFEERVQLARLGGHQGEDTFGDELREQRLAGEHLARVTLGVQSVPQERRHANVALLLILELLVGGAGGGAGLVGRDGHRGEQHRRSHRLQVLRVEVAVVRLAQVEELVPSVGVVQVVLRHPEHLGELGVVGGHHAGVGGLLEDDGQAVDVFDGAERLLPQLKVSRSLELLEPCLQVVLLGLGQRHVRAVALVAVLLQVGQVVAEDLAQAAELGRALVGDAELERAVGRHRVERLQLVVVAQDLKDGAVRLPQKLEPRGDQLAVSAVLVALGGHGLEHEVLGGVLSLQIVDLEGGGRGRSRQGLGRLSLLSGKLQEVLDDLLERVHVHLLAHDPVLDETVFREPPLLQLDAKLHVLEHYRLKDLRPSAMTLGGDHIVQRLERGVGLAHMDQLLRALERILRLRECARVWWHCNLCEANSEARICGRR
mmetsp:Transcript_5961/g.15182  ORF Transcript_5961/g.15182 Transcript_5961/m.15182 type:complete len:437 (-) Transcript_5961:36-1346(-)